MFFNCCVVFFGRGVGREGNYLGVSERVDQYQYLGNYPPTPPLTQQQSIFTMFNYRSRKTHWMNLLKIFLILYQVQERTGRESKVQVLKFALIVFHANLAIIIYISKWTRICNLDSYLIFFFLFLASRSSSVVNPDLNSLVSAVTFGRGMFDDTCAWVCFEAKWPTQLELISVFITWNDKECPSGWDASVLQGYPQAFHQASLKIYPYPFLLYIRSKIYTLKMCKIVKMHKS